MANSARIGLSGNDLDNVFRQLGLNTQVTARLMGKGLAESARIVRDDLKVSLPLGKPRYYQRNRRQRINPGALRRSASSRRVTALINGVRVPGSAAIVGYGRSREAYYANWQERGTAQRQTRSGADRGRIRAGRYLEKALNRNRESMGIAMLRETRAELFRQINYAKRGDKRLDKQLIKFGGV